MKLILIRPPETNRIWVGIPNFFNNGIFLFPPLGIMQLKSYIEKKTSHDVFIYDCLMKEAGYEKTAEFINRYKPDVVGISTFTHSLTDVVLTSKAIRNVDPSIHIVIGGPHTYNFADESRYLVEQKYADSVILGDGEAGLLSLLEAIENKRDLNTIDGIIYRDKSGNIVKNGGPVYHKDLDSLPFPSREIDNIESYYTPASHGRLMTTMISSRGCPYSCKFCNVQRRYRTRSAKDIADEMEELAKKGFEEIFFIDDTFNTSKERVMNLSKEIITRDIKVKWGCKARCDNIDAITLREAKRAGCIRMHYGVETGESVGLDSIDKRVTLKKINDAFRESKKAGIRTVAYFIIGCPHEKKASNILDTIRFSRSIPADFAVFSLLSPYPDAEFYKTGVDKNIIDPTPWDNFIKNPIKDGDLPTAWEEYFTKRELLDFLKLAHRKFYYRPGTVLSALSNVHSLTEFKRLIRGGLSLIKLELLNLPQGRI